MEMVGPAVLLLRDTAASLIRTAACTAAARTLCTRTQFKKCYTRFIWASWQRHTMCIVAKHQKHRSNPVSHLQPVVAQHLGIVWCDCCDPTKPPSVFSKVWRELAIALDATGPNACERVHR